MACSSQPTSINTPSPTEITQSSSTSIPTSVPTSTPARFPAGWFTYSRNSNERIQDMSFDNDGFLWAATDGGLVKWNTTDSTYQKFTTFDGLPSNQVTGVHVDDSGVVWVGTAGGGIASYINNKFIVYKPAQPAIEAEGEITDIVQDSKGTIWFSCSGTGGIGVGWVILPHAGNCWLVFNEEDKSVSAPSDNQSAHWAAESTPGFKALLEEIQPLSSQNNIFFITAVTTDKNGGVWIGTWNSGVIYFDGETYKYFSIKQGVMGNSPYQEPYVMDIVIDHNNTIWFATLGGILNYDGLQTKSYKNSPPAISVTIAPDNSVWAGTQSNGIFHLEGENWVSYRTEDKMPSIIRDIAFTNNGAAWLATGEGVVYADGVSVKIMTKEDGFPSFDIRFVGVAPDQSLWVGAIGCVIQFEQKKPSRYCASENKNGLTGNDFSELYDIEFDNNGVWVAAYGTWYFDGKHWKEYTSDINYEIYNVVRSEHLAISQKLGVWADESYFHEDSWKYYNAYHGFNTQSIAIAPNGDVWVVISGVIKSFDGDNWEIHSIIPGAATNIAFSKDGNLWIGTSMGAYEFDLANQTLSHYTIDDGLAGNIIYKIFTATDGSVWFLTSDGLTRFSNEK